MAAPTSRLSAKPSAGWPAFVVVTALAVYLLPGVGEALVYDRSAILTGELWRLVTGHWVHFSASHLFYDVTVLGSLPLDIRVREGADGGRPSVVSDPDGAIAVRFREIARHVGARLSQRPRNLAQGFAKIVVEGGPR